MSKPIRGGLIAALVVSLALLTVVVAAVGYRSVLAGIGAIGLSGFAIFTLYWPVVLALLGLAWFVEAP
ncbi:MAG TPA: hypothetical protein VGN89_02205, partial [Phenylobacterium sp.]|nr:hypothetical protein [Phenylobacterium sp.]